MVEVKTVHEFTVECRECGNYIDASWEIRYGLENQDTLIVDACATCIIAAVDEAKGEEDE